MITRGIPMMTNCHLNDLSDCDEAKSMLRLFILFNLLIFVCKIRFVLSFDDWNSIAHCINLINDS